MLAGLVLVALVLSARFTYRRAPGYGYVLVVASLAWLLTDKSMEGPTLVRITLNHGVTAGDLAGLVGLLLGVGQVWPDVVRRAGGRRHS
jgi:hypothetical protein